MALWLGLMSALSGDGVEPHEAMPFADVSENFLAASRLGLKAELTWLDGKHWPVRDLLLEELLPRAREGLARKEVDSRDIDHYIGIVEERVRTGRSGARWMLEGYESLRPHASLSERLSAITGAARRQQGAGVPVARWEPPTLSDSGGWKHHYLRVEQFMTRDILTVHPDESVRRAAILMDWGRIRHVPVEEDQKLVGLVSYRTIIKLVAESALDEDEFLPVREVMKTDPISIPPSTPSMAAIRPGVMAGTAYGAAKAASRNYIMGLGAELRQLGIRATSVLPGEVDTPILDNRPRPPSEEERAGMMASEDIAEAILAAAALPERTVIEEMTLMPTRLRDYSADIAAARTLGAPEED